MATTQSPVEQLNWGILGTARIAKSVIPALNASNRNHLTAIASRSQQKAESFANKWEIPRVFGSYEALLSDPNIDVIYIPLPNSLHSEWAIKAALAGKHVLCEKPLALTTAEVDAMAAAASKTNVILAEGFMYRHHEQTLKVKQLVDADEIGELMFVRGSFSIQLSRDGDVRFNPELGGGSLWDIGCYPVNFARFIFGCEPTQVFGWQSVGAAGVDMAFIGQLDFSGDAFAQFDCGFEHPFRTSIEIVGRSGRIELSKPFNPSVNDRIILIQNDVRENIDVFGGQLYLGEVEDMADAILYRKSNRISIEDSRANVAVIEALYESARNNKPMQVLA